MTALTRRIGSFTVSAIGYGAMPLSMGRTPEIAHDDAIATLHAALDAGVTLLDTADIYAPTWDSVGHNEQLVAEALRTYSGDTSDVVVATKGGITRAEGETWGRSADPAHLRAALEGSLERLGVDRIDVYYWHRPDRSRRYADGAEFLASVREEGLVTEVAISNATIDEIDVARDVLGEGVLAAVQNQFSPTYFHASLGELRHCAAHDIAFVPWSPLGGIGSGDRLQKRFPEIAAVAEAHGVSAQQVVLAWELALDEHVLPIPGAGRPASIIDSAAAASLVLTAEEIATLDAAILG
ncbi:aldo/keto reductase [Brachybacterium sp. DNPG3]